MPMHFKLFSRSAYGIFSKRRAQGELSRKDLQFCWDHEVELFRKHAQPIQDWAQMIQNRSDQEPGNNSDSGSDRMAGSTTDPRTMTSGEPPTGTPETSRSNASSAGIYLQPKERWRIPSRDSATYLIQQWMNDCHVFGMKDQRSGLKNPNWIREAAYLTLWTHLGRRRIR
jgi:hypothetical protein